jgi:hypothetical protein
MTINLTEIVRKMKGWCPNAAMLNKKEEAFMVSFERKYINKIKGMGFEGFLSIFHLVFAVWLILTAIMVLRRVQILPWYLMEINIISSGILLAIGISSLMIFFNFVKYANVHRILALVNVVLLFMFSLYLGLSLISGEYMISASSDFLFSIFNRPYLHYTFGIVSLIIFTLVIGLPNILTFFSRPKGERKTRFITTTLLILMIAVALLGVYYFYLNKQKESLLTEENNEYTLYRIDPNIINPSDFGPGPYLYFLDSPRTSTTGHPISKETYEAIQFLRNKEKTNVLGWWDYELEIKAAGKEPVISYASEDIRQTVGRPSLLYDKFDSNEKVVDVAKFFTTDSEEVAKTISDKYGANLVYISKQRWKVLSSVMFMVLNPDFNYQDQGIKNQEDFVEKIIKPTMAYKFFGGADTKYFEKVFENKDVIIYELK